MTSAAQQLDEIFLRARDSRAQLYIRATAKPWPEFRLTLEDGGRYRGEANNREALTIAGLPDKALAEMLLDIAKPYPLEISWDSEKILKLIAEATSEGLAVSLSGNFLKVNGNPFTATADDYQARHGRLLGRDATKTLASAIALALS